jgi:putative ABC transport system permease protein
MYADVKRTGNIFTSFAILAIIIACLGLFALSAFMAEQRNKEIGIRKVLGASVSGITTMLSKDFLKLVILSIVIASPFAYWAMTKWLQDYAYRISIAWWMIAVAGFCCNCNCVDNDNLSNYKSSDCKSCEEFENGVNPTKPPLKGRLKTA